MNKYRCGGGIGDKMKVTYDPKAMAMYFKFTERGIGGTTEELLPDWVFIDKTVLGQISGIEILGVEFIEDITGKYASLLATTD